MRVIKFRVYDKEGRSFCPEWSRLEFLSVSEDCSYTLGQLLISDSDNYIIQQFTGFTDIEGNKIYEGDICKYISPYYSFYKSQNDCHIYYKQDYASMFISSNKGHFDLLINNKFCNECLSVIGNINENPELI